MPSLWSDIIAAFAEGSRLESSVSWTGPTANSVMCEDLMPGFLELGRLNRIGSHELIQRFHHALFFSCTTRCGRVLIVQFRLHFYLPRMDKPLKRRSFSFPKC